MLVDEMLSTSELISINGNDKTQMFSSFRDTLLHFLRIHLRVVEGFVPKAEGCAWRRADDPFRLLLLDQVPGLDPVLLPAEVPRSGFKVLK